jgi:hypothetical protein
MKLQGISASGVVVDRPVGAALAAVHIPTADLDFDPDLNWHANADLGR